MVSISLDSSVIIDVINGVSAARREKFFRLRSSGQSLVVSAIVLHEVTYGASVSGRPDVQRRMLNSVIDGLPVADFAAADAMATNEVRARLRAGGNTIKAFDTLIAGQAYGRGWTVATSDLKDFSRVEGLAIMDWLAAPEGNDNG